MKYTVVWRPTAESDLARIWMTATNRRSVSSAADQIDLVLKHDPLDVGESRSDSERVLILQPLGVKFLVREQDRIVEVLDVWSFYTGGAGR